MRILKDWKSKFVNWLLKDQHTYVNEIIRLRQEYLRLVKESSDDFSRNGKELHKIRDQHVNLHAEQVDFLHQFDQIFGKMKVSVDIHERSPSWAVISLQGERADYVQFVDLGQRDVRDIQHFLRRFDRKNVAIDAPIHIPKREWFRL